MAVKIITYHRAVNYGAVLQAYALARAIREYVRPDVFIYDHVNEKIANSYALFKKSKNPAGTAIQIATLPFKLKKHAKFKAFTDKYIPLSANVSDGDIFITGSDQVWNYRGTDFDKAYFLDFVKRKENRNSYAASFGLADIEDSYFDEYKRLLSNFNNISVREERGREIVQKMTGRDVPVVLDPTLLLSAEEWRKELVHTLKHEDYILVYLMVKTPTVIDFVKKLAERTGLVIYYINDYALPFCKKCSVMRCIGPEEWVSLFSGAEYVVTNSFHGTAFSINFNKKFFVEMQPEEIGVNSRLENILDKFGLNERIIKNSDSEAWDKTIDYDRVNRILYKEKEKSMAYLENIAGKKE
ncbi:MAG: polysaccharide pyruvyl transferase family protein [Firmicutes bacterium]|nr:polysaccharide pyruvyl transferase family protein [Bacillota bacterium]